MQVWRRSSAELVRPCGLLPSSRERTLHHSLGRDECSLLKGMWRGRRRGSGHDPAEAGVNRELPRNRNGTPRPARDAGAEKVLQSAIGLQGANSQTFSGLGRERRGERNWPGAVSTWHLVTELAPDDTEAYRGFVDMGGGDLINADGVLRETIRHNLMNADAHDRLGPFRKYDDHPTQAPAYGHSDSSDAVRSGIKNRSVSGLKEPGGLEERTTT